LALGLDLGGTTYGVGLLDAQGQLIASDSHPTPGGEAPALLGELARTALALAARTAPEAELVGLGIGIPGPVQPEAGVVVQCPNLHVLDGAPAATILQAATGLPTYLGNDAYCATLAELRYGAGREIENMALLTLGTGVGGGIALDNKVRRGPRQIMGEVGHLVIEPGGPKCGCGNHGCLEALVGRQPLIDRAIALLQTGRPSRLADVVGADHSLVDPRLIADLAREGDALCSEVMNRMGYYLGLAICNVIVLCDPDRVVIGGGIAAAGEVIFAPLRRTVQHVSQISRFDPAQIVPAELGNEAGMYGAGALVWEQVG
jgi:glucokinase